MPSECVRVKLGDLAHIKHGFAFKGEHFVDEPTPNVLVTPGNFAIGGGFQSTKLKFYRGPVPEDYVLLPGDLVVTMTDLSRATDTLGYAAVVPKVNQRTYLHNQRIGLVEVTQPARVMKSWLHYLMRTREYRAWVVGSATGSTVKHTSPSRICDYEFDLPGLRKQREAAATLDALEARIDLLRQTNTTIESIAQALFKSWFIDFDTVRAKQAGREPEGMDAATAALFPAEFEESALGLIPKGWTCTRLGGLIELVYGKALKATERREGSIPVYGSGGVAGYHDEPLVSEGSVIVGRKGTVGSLYWEDRPFYPIDTTFYVRPKSAPLTFCYYAMQRLGLDKMNTDAAVPGLNRENAYRVELIKPSDAVLCAFDKVVSALRAAIHGNNVRAKTVSSLRDTLLPRLISGKLRLPEAKEQLEESFD